MNEALEALEKEQFDQGLELGRPVQGCGRPSRAVKPKTTSNLTDPHNRMISTKTEGFIQDYNAQVVVNADTQPTVATDPVQDRCDQGQVVKMVDKVEQTCCLTPATIVADAGCRKEADLQTLERRGLEAIVAPGTGASPIDLDTLPATMRMAEQLRTLEGK